ncbi:MAG: cell division protein ZapE [Halioglobus sp.]
MWFSFDTLCNTPRSTEDYIEIASVFGTVLISDIPVMDEMSSDAARRFVNLIDEFYDRHVKLVVSAEATADKLYTGKRLAFEFDRAASRLFEMQTTDYLSSGRTAKVSQG